MSICRACLKRDKALDIGLPEENWHVLDRLVLAIRTTDINYSMANGNDEENLTVAPYMDYTRLFQRLLYNSPLTGLRQSSSHWRSVIHTGRSAKISSNVSICLLQFISVCLCCAWAMRICCFPPGNHMSRHYLSLEGCIWGKKNGRECTLFL